MGKKKKKQKLNKLLKQNIKLLKRGSKVQLMVNGKNICYIGSSQDTDPVRKKEVLDTWKDIKDLQQMVSRFQTNQPRGSQL